MGGGAHRTLEIGGRGKGGQRSTHYSQGAGWELMGERFDIKLTLRSQALMTQPPSLPQSPLPAILPSGAAPVLPSLPPTLRGRSARRRPRSACCSRHHGPRRQYGYCQRYDGEERRGWWWATCRPCTVGIVGGPRWRHGRRSMGEQPARAAATTACFSVITRCIGGTGAVFVN